MKRYAIIKQNTHTGQYEYQLWRCVPGQRDVLAADWQWGPFDFNECIKQVRERFGSEYDCMSLEAAHSMLCYRCGKRHGAHSFKVYQCPAVSPTAASLFEPGQYFQLEA